MSTTTTKIIDTIERRLGSKTLPVKVEVSKEVRALGRKNLLGIAETLSTSQSVIHILRKGIVFLLNTETNTFALLPMQCEKQVVDEDGIISNHSYLLLRICLQIASNTYR